MSVVDLERNRISIVSVSRWVISAHWLMNGPPINISIIYIWTAVQESQQNFVSSAVSLHRTGLIFYENRPQLTSILLR